jgi:hypothetical protein
MVIRKSAHGFLSPGISANSPTIDINYFPSQQRTVISGISWLF